MFCLDFHRDNLLKLTKKIDSSFFFYDLDLLETHLEKLKSLPTKLWYAVKANPLSNIIQSVNKQGISFDVASVGELNQVLKQGVDPQNILNTGPAKSYKQICYFLNKGVRVFVLESTQQYEDLLRATKKYGVQVRVLLRVQIKWQKSNEKNVLGGDRITPFGLPPQMWESYFKHKPLESKYVNIIGLHCFQWGNITNINKLSCLWETITQALVDLAEQIAIDLQIIDLGGGLGIPYNNQTERLEVDDIKKVIDRLKAKHPKIEFWLELGRYAVGECGVYVTEIIDRKKFYNKDLLVLEGGSQHLIRPFIADQAFPVFNLSYSTESKELAMELHGPLCTSIDYLGSVSLPKDTMPGHSLVFKQVGAYGFTESMPFFLCHTLPAEVIYKHQETLIVREAQKAQQWLV